jgi:hypothetical protein
VEAMHSRQRYKLGLYDYSGIREVTMLEQETRKERNLKKMIMSGLMKPQALFLL